MTTETISRTSKRTDPPGTPATQRFTFSQKAMVMTPRVREALAAASQPAGWTYLLSATGTQSAPMVANIQNNDPNRGAQIIVYPLKPNSLNDLWLFTAEGYIVSGLRPMMCLTADGDNVVSTPVTEFGDVRQLWSLSSDGTIASRVDNRVLTAGTPGVEGYPNVGVADLESPLPPQQIWSIYPDNPLTRILTQEPEPFPTAPAGSGSAIAYAAIMSQLGGPGFDLRTQYLNLAAPLAAWLSTILTMPRPDGVADADWVAVQQQLGRELTAAIAVQTLFANYTVCHQALFSSQEAILNKAIVDASIETSAKTHSLFGLIVWSIIYVGLETDPGTAVVANIIQCALNVAAAAKRGGVVSSNAFSADVSALWNLLDEGFDEILQATAVIENEILGDWGRLQTTYAGIIAGSQGNLAWPAAMTAEIVGNSVSSFQTAMLQALVPSKYQIYFLGAENKSVGDPPADGSCEWVHDDNYFEIASAPGGSDVTFPDYMMKNDILPPSSVPLTFFYLGQGGWATPRASRGNDDDITLMVNNQTDRFIQLSVSQGTTQQGTAGPIAPWDSAPITWRFDDPVDATLFGDVGQELARFSIGRGNDDHSVFVYGQSTEGGYGFSTPVTYPGTSGISASCQITIFTKSA